jgi:tryptophan halogenase
MRLFPFNGEFEQQAERFNTESRFEWEEVRDFIILHYKQNARDDAPLWRQCREMPIPPELDYRMKLFAGSGRVMTDERDLFAESNWISVLLGQRITPARHDPLADLIPLEETRRRLTELRGLIRTTVTAMPAHEAFIAAQCQAPSRASS